MIQGQLKSLRQLNVRQRLFVMHMYVGILFAVTLRLKKAIHVQVLVRIANKDS